MAAALVLSVLAAVVIGGQGTGRAEGMIVVLPPPGELSLQADVFPRALPKRVRTPVRLTIAGEAKGGTDGVPILKELHLDLDRSFGFDLHPFSACGEPSLDRIGGHGEPERVRAKCRSSIVAEGTVEFLLRFPENTPIPVRSDLTLFMGDIRDGSTTLYLHAHNSIPTPQAIVATVELKRIRDGRYGTRATISIPKIAGGAGAITSFRLTIPRRTLATGEPHSVASLRCADGRAQIQATSTFASGETSVATAVRRCATVPEP